MSTHRHEVQQQEAVLSSEEQLRPTNWVGTGDPEASTDWVLPQRFGPFILRKVLGRGSMGTVYLADQEQPVRREVALKVLGSRGRRCDLMSARFETERQALAVMNHPNIATVYDAGATDEGMPYFAMEVVQGEPITSYCDYRKLGIKERLELFLQVCDAIQHAHQKLVIHRDIKPSNVLVTVQNGKAVPKVIDFGVAKSIEKPLTGSAETLDDAEIPVGTPMYMSPEQMGGDSRTADARADVYALGVLLYELLAGPVPFDTWTAAIPQLLVRLLEYQPPPPSERVRRQLADGERIAAARSTTTTSLERLLRGDLDSIVMKAIAKDRNQRYGSVSALQADLIRHLRHEPVSAMPATGPYRLGKFLRRYRRSVAATVLMFLALIGVIAAYAVGLGRARQARDEALAAQQRAAATMEYLRKVLGTMDVGVEGYEVRVVDMLTRTSQLIDSELAGQPEIEAEVRKSIGLSLLELGIFDDAGKELKRALDLQQQILGAVHPETLRTHNSLARLWSKLARYREAAELHAAVLAEQEQILGEEHEETLWTMYNLAKDYHKLGRWQEAEDLFRRNIAIRRHVLGPEHLHTLVAINSLSLFLGDRGKPQEAEQLQRENLLLLKERVGLSHPDTLRARANLVEILNQLGRYAEAEQLSRTTLTSQQQVFGEQHPETLGTRSQLALALLHQGQAAEAERLGRRVLAVRRVRLGERHPDTLESKLVLGLALVELGEVEEGLAYLDEAVSTTRQVLPAKHWKTADFATRYGRCLVKLGRYAEAEPLLLEAYQTRLETHPAVAPDTAAALVTLYKRWGKPEQARRYLTPAEP